MLEFTVEQKQLFKALTALTRINAKVQKDSILQNILFKKIDKNNIELISSDMTTSAKYIIQAKNVEGNGILYNSQTLLGIISNLNGCINFKDGKIVCDKNEYKISTIDAIRYPEIKFEKNDEQSFEYNTEDLKNAISNVSYATSKIDGVLSGIYFNNDEVVACDSNRICISKLKSESSFLLSKKIGDEILKLFINEKVNIYINNNNLYIYDENIILKSVTINGKYPEYKKLLPTEQKYTVKFIKQDLLNAINLLYPVLDLKFPICKIMIKNNNAILLGNNIDNEGSTEFEVESNIENTITIGFNAQYLLDMLRNYDNEITMKIKEYGQGIVFEDNKNRYSMICPLI